LTSSPFGKESSVTVIAEDEEVENGNANGKERGRTTSRL
jgi:hypothetical protein